MPTVAELTALYTNFMLGPRAGPDVCRTCLTFTKGGFAHCYTCAHTPQHLDAVVPISYSVAHEQLHHALARYKRLHGGIARQLTVQLAAVLWRFLANHEPCLARAAGTPQFTLVTTVPSSDRQRDAHHPLRQIVGEIVGPTKQRHERLLARSQTATAGRAFDEHKYEPTRQLANRESVLLIDDTWTTGANAQSAAAALKRAGAGSVAIVVIGRHLNREWHQNDRRLRGVAAPFDWDRCALCVTPERCASPARPRSDR